jgi:hypothetical protein
MNSPKRKSSISPAPVLTPKLAPLAKGLAQAQAKIKEDLFRFRTCCADPRASK